MAKQRKPGWWYPWIFVGFFGVIVTVNGIMMYFAFDSWTGLETKDHYVKGLAYEKNVQGAKAQAALGWDVKLEVETLSAADKSRTIAYKVTFLDHNKKPLEPLRAHTFFVRPTHEGLDVNGRALTIAPGVLAGEATLALAGQWDVRIHAESRGRQYQHVERIVIE